MTNRHFFCSLLLAILKKAQDLIPFSRKRDGESCVPHDTPSSLAHSNLKTVLKDNPLCPRRWDLTLSQLKPRYVIPSTGGLNLILSSVELTPTGELSLVHSLQLLTISLQFHAASRSGIECFLLVSWIASVRHKRAQNWTSVYYRHHCGPGGLFSILMPFRERCELLFLLIDVGRHPEGN